MKSLGKELLIFLLSPHTPLHLLSVARRGNAVDLNLQHEGQNLGLITTLRAPPPAPPPRTVLACVHSCSGSRGSGGWRDQFTRVCGEEEIYDLANLVSKSVISRFQIWDRDQRPFVSPFDKWP